LFCPAGQDFLRYDASKGSSHQGPSLSRPQHLIGRDREDKLNQVLIEEGVAGFFERLGRRRNFRQIVRHRQDSGDARAASGQPESEVLSGINLAKCQSGALRKIPPDPGLDLGLLDKILT
jgi:hypothetical protein